MYNYREIYKEFKSTEEEYRIMERRYNQYENIINIRNQEVKETLLDIAKILRLDQEILKLPEFHYHLEGYYKNDIDVQEMIIDFKENYNHIVDLIKKAQSNYEDEQEWLNGGNNTEADEKE